MKMATELNGVCLVGELGGDIIPVYLGIETLYCELECWENPYEFLLIYSAPLLAALS